LVLPSCTVHAFADTIACYGFADDLTLIARTLCNTSVRFTPLTIERY
jgi:hypothetical protein